MKLTTILAALLMSATIGFSQGSIVFNNRVTGTIITHIYAPLASSPANSRFGQGTNDFPVGSTDYTGAVGLAGTGFTVQLWGGPASATANELTLATNGTAVFRTGAAAGFIQQPSGANPTVAQGITLPNQNLPAAIQLRAWDNAGGTITSWAAAMATPGLAIGSSPLFISQNLGGGPITSPNLVGLQTFSLAVPEPSIIALGVLGLGVLLFRRRK